jgi:CRP/FNR family transcriptional regulator, cyclic AMP receptor protein
VLVKELDVGRRLIVIREGSAGVIRHGHRVATVGPGDVVGELSLIDGQPTSASVVADTNLEALVLHGTRFQKLLSSTPQLYPRLLVGLAARVRTLDHVRNVTG